MSVKGFILNNRGKTTLNICIATAVLAVAALIFYASQSLNEPVFTPEEVALPPAPSFVETPLAENEIRVHYIDLGQADGILIQSGKNAVLIDGGEHKTRDTLANYLRRAGIAALDYVVATHPHSDHIGGLPAVIQLFDVKDVLMPDAVHTTATFETLISAIENKGLSVTVPTGWTCAQTC
jgi:beta-lactamase superfamily II metal-dependent hydrolase